MKYCVVIIDGAAGWPLPERGGKTCLELAHTPNLDAMAEEGTLGLARTVPPGMEPSSGNACMAVLGYDPEIHHRGRAAIEARSMGITIDEGEAAFRCSLVTVVEGKLMDYSAGHISTEEAHQLIAVLNEKLGNDDIHFHLGISYRHICKIKGREDTLLTTCTQPTDIQGQPFNEFLPTGPGSELLRDLILRSADMLRDHPVNIKRWARGDKPANMIWLFWSSGPVSDLPAFEQVYGLKAAMTSAVDVLQGLALMTGMTVLDIPGVTDGLDNDFTGQAAGGLAALQEHDLVVIHIEAADEAGHAGSIDDKIEAIQRVDREIISQIRSWRGDSFRVLVMPDHLTPIQLYTHNDEPVPFMLWGAGFTANGVRRFTESEAAKTGLFIDPGYNIMSQLIRG